MIQILRLEFFKIRRKKLGIMIALFVAVEMLWAFMSLSRYIDRNPDHAVWESVLFTVSSMNGLFMPIVSAVVVSRICDMEHKGATWKLLVASNVKRGFLYAAKYICANSLLLSGILGQTVLMIVFGRMIDLSGVPPVEWFIRFMGGTLLTTLAVTALQQWISVAVKNQTFALCLGMVGGFFGMTAALFPEAVRLMWSYYTDLGPITYRYAESSGEYIVQPLTADFGIATAALMMTFLFYIAGSIHVARQEI